MSSPNELSFLPEDYLERKALRRTNFICAGLFVIVLTSIGSAFTYSERSNRDIDKQYDAKLREFTAEAQRIHQADMMQEKQRTMSRQAELAASLLEKVPRSFLIAEITNAMPPGVSLTEFNLESKVHQNPTVAARTNMSAFEQKKAADAKKAAAGENPDVKVYDVAMRIHGIAPTDVQVAEFIRKLNASPLLKDVNLVITDQFTNKENEVLRKFQVECNLNPNAEVQSAQNSKSNTTAAVEMSK
jgi:Tfp pilus assembly protein PilN